MLLLDSLSNLMPKDRALRKDTVCEIEVLLKSLDTTRAGLSSVQKNLRKLIDNSEEELDQCNRAGKQNGNRSRVSKSGKTDEQETNMKNEQLCYEEGRKDEKIGAAKAPGMDKLDESAFWHQRGYSVVPALFSELQDQAQCQASLSMHCSPVHKYK